MNAKLVWITGASSGIGAETARQMARKGWNVAVSARSEDKLKALVKEAESYPGEIHSYPGDVTNANIMHNIVNAIEKDHGEIDIALLNAGTYFGESGADFSAESFKKTFDINVNGIANCLEPLLKNFRKRGPGKEKGHVAIVASVAGYRGLPQSVAYGPTKAALINMTEALYMDCKPQGIKVQLVCPGFVRTPLTDKNKFPMPMLMEVEDAAAALIKGLESNQFEITFPWAFALILKTLGLLPNKAYLWLVSQGTKGKV